RRCRIVKSTSDKTTYNMEGTILKDRIVGQITVNYAVFLFSILPTNYVSGSFAGSPAFLGYFFGVFFIFSTFTIALPISVPGRLNLSTLFISPPRIFTAFSEFFISLSESALLYEQKYPVIPTKGRQYSHNVDKFATARETHRSNCSLNSFFFA